MADVLLRTDKDGDAFTAPYYRLFSVKNETIRNATTGAFVTSVAWATSAHKLVENTHIKGVFPITIPDLPDGEYMMTVYDNASPADTDLPLGDTHLFMPARIFVGGRYGNPLIPDGRVKVLNSI